MKKTIYFLGYIIGFIIIAYISYTYVKMGISHTNDIFLKKGYFVLATAVFVTVLASLIYLKLTKFSIVKIYPIVLTLFGLAYMYVFPAMSAPDEIAHFISAYKISNIMLGERATVTDGHVIIRAGDLWLEDTENEWRKHLIKFFMERGIFAVAIAGLVLMERLMTKRSRYIHL